MAKTTIISINELKAGMHVVGITEQQGPVKIRKSGMITSNDMVNGLKEMGVTELEVDLELSVELDTGAVSTNEVSQTKKLLMEKNARQVDEQMSEQFNRSLFLPSLQRMPSYSELLAKTAIRYAGVFLLGFTLGYAVIFGLNVNTSALHIAQKSPPPTTALEAQQTVDNTAVSHEANTAKQNQINASTDAQQLIVEAPQSPNTSADDTSTSPTGVGTDSNSFGDPINTSEVNSPDNAVQDATANNTSLAQSAEKNTAENNGDNSKDNTEEIGRVLQVPQEDVTPSPEVAAAVANVIAELESEPVSETANAVRVTNASELPRIGELSPFLLTQIPSMVFAQHMYSSVDSERYVRVNNRRLQEGDRIAGKVLIERIEPQQLVLSINGTRFTMAALTDW